MAGSREDKLGSADEERMKTAVDDPTKAGLGAIKAFDRGMQVVGVHLAKL